jgi:hypothetical protein
MTDINALPADQRAALQLLLKQGQTYDQLASLLGIGADAVRTRAHAAVEALGGGIDLDEADRARVADFLLGQQSASERDATHDLIAGSPDAQSWARGVSDALQPLGANALPEIPGGEAAVASEPEAPAREPEPAGYEAEPETEPAAYEREPVRDRRDREPIIIEPAPFEEPEPAARARAKPPAEPRPSSRLGGALLLGGLGIIVAVVLILIINGGGDDNKSKAGSTLSSNPATQTNAGQQRPIAQINLVSASGDAAQVGLAQVFENGRRRAIIVAGQGMKPGAYALWLYNSKSDAKLLGFVPERVGKDGRFATQGELPTNADKYDQLIVTKEKVTKNTKKAPAKPGKIVLEGAVALQ